MSTSTPRSSGSQFDLFAATAPGLESITAGELKTLGIKGRQEPGGVAFDGDLDRLYTANLWLRTASRVLLRLGRFHASTFYELERRAKKLRWSDFLPATGLVEVRVTCRKSRLYHSDAVAERILGAIASVAPPGVNLQIAASTSEDDAREKADATNRSPSVGPKATGKARPNGDATDRSQSSSPKAAGKGGPNGDATARSQSSSPKAAGKGGPNGDATARSQSFIVRIVNDECEISADSSGELLHRRGYRQEVAKAPLRETLAAAMVLASGWDGSQPLLDPMCGSGTIPIEAALIGRRAAPGLGRNFQFMNWTSFDRRLWDDLTGKAEESVVNVALDIRGADRDAGAIQAATRNAERAGVGADIRFSTEALSISFAALEDVADGEGWIITNPPYGIRVGESADLRDLYATLGNGVKSKRGWRIGILAAEDSLAGQMRLPVRSRFDTQNGGIPVRYLVSERSEQNPDSVSRPVRSAKPRETI
jgi:23S rRNA G2445 N2-methylase RlmL